MSMYIVSIPPETYTVHAFPLPRFGHLTSNIIESLNGSWKQIRSFPPLLLLTSIWSKVIETFAERRDRLMPLDICPAIKLLFEQRYSNSRRYQVIASDTSIYQIIN